MVAAATALHSTGVKAQTRAGPLASWNDGAAKQAILDFVRATTDRSSKAFVATGGPDRHVRSGRHIVDWSTLSIRRPCSRSTACMHWHRNIRNGRAKSRLKSVLSNDPAAVGKFTERDWFEIIVATHSGMSTEAFPDIVAKWLEAARDRRFKRPYTELVYQPMREVMEYLRDNGFKNLHRHRWWAGFRAGLSQQPVYEVPPEQVVGSSEETKYEMKDGKPVLMRLPKVSFIDDGDGKAIGIDRVYRQAPICGLRQFRR